MICGLPIKNHFRGGVIATFNIASRLFFRSIKAIKNELARAQGQSRAAHSTIGETGNYEHNQPNKTSRKILLARLNDALHLKRFIVRADDSLTEFWISNDAIALATNDRNACC